MYMYMSRLTSLFSDRDEGCRYEDNSQYGESYGMVAIGSLGL